MNDPVQMFEAAVDALNAVDRARIAEVVDPQIMFVPLRSAVTGAYLGHQGIEEFITENESRYEYFRADFEELRPLPGGRLLCVGNIAVRGKGSDEEILYPTAGVAMFRDGRLASWRDYGSVAAALEAAGEA